MNSEIATPLTQIVALARKNEEAGHRQTSARFYRLAGAHARAGGKNVQAVELLDRALALTSDDTATQRFEVLAHREQLLGLLGRVEAQKQDLSALEALANKLDDDGRRALVAARQAEFRINAGDLDAAASLARLALRLAQLSGAAFPATSAHLTLGHILLQKADFSAAERHLRRAADQATLIDAVGLQADALRNLGVLANDRERFEEATALYDEATALYEQLDDRRGLAQIHNNLGHVYAHQGHLARAQRHWQETHRLFDSVDDAEGSVRILVNLGAINLDLGQYDDACGFLQEARRRAETINLVPGLCFASLNLALATHRQEQHEAAVTHAATALEIARRMGARRLEGAALMVKAHAFSGQGEFAQAGDLYWEALALWEELGLPNLAAEARAGLARIALANHAASLGMFFVEEIVARMAVDPRLEGAESPVQVYLSIYRVLKKEGDPRAAEVLDAGHRLLMERAHGLAEESTREALLRNVPAHRELLAAFGQE